MDYDTIAYRRSETDVANGGATWRVMFVHSNYRLIEYCPAFRQVARLCPHPGITIADIRTLSEVDSWKTVSLSKSHLGKINLWDVH